MWWVPSPSAETPSWGMLESCRKTPFSPADCDTGLLSTAVDMKETGFTFGVQKPKLCDREG